MSEQYSIAELLKKAFPENLQGTDLNAEEDKSYGEDYIAQLKAACCNFLKKESFKVGQLVKWKKDLKNRQLPYKNQPAIVVSILDEPIVSTEDEAGSPYFLETLDMILGIITDNGTFLTFYYDSRRFEAY
jgi:hypothetical protein